MNASGHGLEPAVLAPGSGERFAGAGGDAMLLRFETAGDGPLAIIEDTSSDAEARPLHSHPWDELIYVLEGEMSLTCGEETRVGGPGTLATLPRGSAHTLHVTNALARFLMITVGAPSSQFLKEVGEVYATGPTRDRLVEVARRHGVEPRWDEAES